MSTEPQKIKCDVCGLYCTKEVGYTNLQVEMIYPEADMPTDDKIDDDIAICRRCDLGVPVGALVHIIDKKIAAQQGEEE